MSDAADVIRRLYEEALNAEDLDVVDEVFDPGFVSHTRPPELPPGAEGVKAFFRQFRDAFSDFDLQIDQLICEGEWVAVATTTSGTHDRGELLGLKPTGKRVTVPSVDLIRVREGRIVEHRGVMDSVSLVRQLSQ